MGSCLAITHPLSPLLSLPSLHRPLLFSSALSTKGKACALGCGPEVCGQGCLYVPEGLFPFPGAGEGREGWDGTPVF